MNSQTEWQENAELLQIICHTKGKQPIRCDFFLYCCTLLIVVYLYPRRIPNLGKNKDRIELFLL